MNEKIAAATKTFESLASQTKQNLEGILKANQEQVEKASQTFYKGYEELASFNKDNLEALVKSGTIVAKGAEEAGKAVAAFAQSSLEKSVANSKALLGVKTVADLFNLQATLAKQNFDTLLAETSRMSELSVKVANEALAPINARFNATVEKLAKPVAA